MRHHLQKEARIDLQRALLTWYAQSQRDLPWRKTRDPYAIWLSETMLQQTRVTTVMPYYDKFLQLFPTVSDLAEAPEPTLLSAWAGLGYYYRARNLQKAARLIHELSAFPSTYDSIRALPGVGDYTAAAVASIAFNLPHAVVDGNVLRVLARLFADATDIATARGRQHFAALAQDLLDHDQPSAFNQAVMELGATICLPRNPKCLLCPVSTHCQARESARQHDFPVKATRSKTTMEERTVYWIEQAGAVLAWQRPPDSKLMPGFWELPEPLQLPNLCTATLIGAFRHGITTHNYRFTVYNAPVPDERGICEWLNLNELAARPTSTVFQKALRLLRAQPERLAAKVN